MEVRIFALHNTQGCCRARGDRVLHSSVTYTRAVNRSVNIRSEIKLGAHVRTCQRPQAPYRWVPGLWAIPSMAGLHGPAGPWPPLAGPGTCGAARAGARAHPKTVPAGRASGAAARSPCTPRQAAGAPHARRSYSRTRRGRLRRPARPCSGLQQPRAPDRALRRPPWQPSAAASRRPHGGLSACGVRQAGCHASVEVWARGWRSMRQVVVELVRVRRW